MACFKAQVNSFTTNMTFVVSFKCRVAWIMSNFYIFLEALNLTFKTSHIWRLSITAFNLTSRFNSHCNHNLRHFHFHHFHRESKHSLEWMWIGNPIRPVWAISVRICTTYLHIGITNLKQSIKIRQLLNCKAIPIVLSFPKFKYVFVWRALRVIHLTIQTGVSENEIVRHEMVVKSKRNYTVYPL